MLEIIFKILLAIYLGVAIGDIIRALEYRCSAKEWSATKALMFIGIFTFPFYKLGILLRKYDKEI